MGNYLSTSNKESINIIDNPDHLHVIMSTSEELQKEENQEKHQNLKTNEETEKKEENDKVEEPEKKEENDKVEEPENTQNVIRCDTAVTDDKMTHNRSNDDDIIFYKKNVKKNVNKNKNNNNNNNNNKNKNNKNKNKNKKKHLQ